MITTTIHCTLLAKEEDIMNYQTLVFKNLDKAPFGFNYCMVTVWPNWESYIPKIGDIGYLTYDSVVGGVDTYYDIRRNGGNHLVPNYDSLITAGQRAAFLKKRGRIDANRQYTEEQINNYFESYMDYLKRVSEHHIGERS